MHPYAVCLILFGGGLAFFLHEFGPLGAVPIALLLVFPLVVAMRLHRRLPAVRGEIDPRKKHRSLTTVHSPLPTPFPPAFIARYRHKYDVPPDVRSVR